MFSLVLKCDFMKCHGQDFFIELKAGNDYASFKYIYQPFFGLILLMAALSGLFIPPVNLNTATIIIVSLAVIIFASFFKVELNRELFTDDILPASKYFIIRL